MTLSLRIRAGIAAFAAVALATTLFAAACGDDSGGSKELDTVAAINILDKAGLHGLDDSMTKDKTIPATAPTTYHQLQTITVLTRWPNSDLEKKADALAKIFGEAAGAVDGDKPDITKAAEAAHNAHEAEHDFSHAVWDYLYGKAGVKVGADEEQD